MRYAVSDLHGEYQMFCRLLEVIRFSERDEMYICGDIFDKGPGSVRLARLILSRPNMHLIMGNHEHAFLQYYHALTEETDASSSAILAKLQAYFPQDGHLLDWETVDRLEELPYYMEGEDFLCVHAGLPVREDGTLTPPEQVEHEILIHDRRFRRPDVTHTSPKCVLFGHTQTDTVCGEARILPYRRPGVEAVRGLCDLYKVHLDTGIWRTGVMGCFCLDTCRTQYLVKKTRAGSR